MESITPTVDEVRNWLVATLQHSCHVEYFLHALREGLRDEEMPHDLVGPGNKYEWDVIKGFALQYRVPKVDFQTFIQPALVLHRQQYHHRKWNEPDPNDKNRPAPNASSDDMVVGAIDAVCSLLENRQYQGGEHSYEKVTEVTDRNPPHKVPWTRLVLPRMKVIKQPDFKTIADLAAFPNIGLPADVYAAAQKRTQETRTMLRSHGYDINS